MKFLFISATGGSLDIAFRVTQEGNQVRMWIMEKDWKDVGDGIIEKVDNWEAHVSWADVVVDDFVFEKGNVGKKMDELRKKGKLVFGGGEFGEKIENDREYGMDIAMQAGMEVPEYFKFKNFNDAEKFIKKNPFKYVVKPNGQTDKNLCYVGKDSDGSDVINYFDSFKEKSPLNNIDFTLQKVIDGIEVACSSYFTNGHFMENINYNFEHKRLLAGNLGGNTGETGTILFNRPAETGNKNSVFKQNLALMEPFLAKADYRGWIDVNSIANEEGTWFLEFTSRWGYPQSLIMRETMRNEWSRDIYNVASGNMKKWDVDYDFAAGIVVYSEGFPYPCAYEKLGKNREIRGVNAHTYEHLRFGEVRRKDEKFFAAGMSGESMVATGKGRTALEAVNTAKVYADKLDFVNKGYRNDIGISSDRDYNKLVSMGYL